MPSLGISRKSFSRAVLRYVGLSLISSQERLTTYPPATVTDGLETNVLTSRSNSLPSKKSELYQRKLKISEISVMELLARASRAQACFFVYLARKEV